MYEVRLRVKEYLKKAGITQLQLATLTGIRKETISEICRNSRTVINKEQIAKIAQVLGVTDIRDLIELKID